MDRCEPGTFASVTQSAKDGEEATAVDLMPQFNVSMKPQKIAPKFPGTVRNLLHAKIRDAYIHPQFVTDVMKPMLMDNIIDELVTTLSGGELQRTAITLALGKPADIYLIDEPSAYLDSEQRYVHLHLHLHVPTGPPIPR